MTRMRLTNLGIRSRMLLAALLPVTLVATLLATVFLVVRVGDNAQAHQQRARSLIRQVALASEYGLFSGNTASLQTIFSGVLLEADVRAAAIVDAQGTVLARVGKPADARIPALSAREATVVDASNGVDLLIQPVLAAQTKLDDPLERSSGPELAGAAPQLLGHVVMEFSRESLNRRERDMLAAGIAITLGGLLFGGALAVLIGRGVLRPIMRVSRMIRRIGDGELSVRNEVLPGDPLRDLQRGLNQMAEQIELGHDDMSRRIEAATAALREKKEEAEIATRAKSQFLAAASHDLRQPTHALGMFVARLGQLPHDAQTQHLVASLDASVRAMQDLLDGLLDVSRLDAGAVQVNLNAVPLAPIFEQVRLAMQDAATEKGLRLRVRPTNAWVRSDPVLLQRILLNLVANAVRYTHQGTVLLACRMLGDGGDSGERSGAGSDTGSGSGTGARARIEVWDSGIGIAPEHQTQVFREFYQVGNSERDRTRGLGLGLNIVKRTAHLLGHPFALRSSLGHGSRFTLEVPLVPAGLDKAVAATTDALTGASLAGLAVMVIEDDALAAAGLAGLLQSWGCAVTAVDGQQQALAQMAQTGAPDVIVSDYRLRNGENGIAAVSALCGAAGRRIAACLMSGDTDPALILQAREAGLTLLHKPVRPAKLRSLLRSLTSRAPDAPAQNKERQSSALRA
jgi:two-component system, sensor histidine kinase